jgi:hypothetical protein
MKDLVKELETVLKTLRSSNSWQPWIAILNQHLLLMELAWQ